jgi:uncharacterized Zn finger protein
VEEVTFQVRGSSPKPYEVIFIKDGDSLTAVCNCPAGTYGNVCKHRTAILEGDPTAITSDNAGRAPDVVGWLAGTDVESALAALRAAEKIKPADKGAVADAKRKLARVMNT